MRGSSGSRTLGGEQECLTSSIRPSVCLELYWTAPELLREDLQPATGTPQGDVFSFAIILWELMFGTKAGPYHHLNLEPKGKCSTATSRRRTAAATLPVLIGRPAQK